MTASIAARVGSPNSICVSEKSPRVMTTSCTRASTAAKAKRSSKRNVT